MRLMLTNIKKNIPAIFFILVLLTLNITKVIHITEKLRFNMALSDSFVIFAMLIILYSAYKEKAFKFLKGLPIWLTLIAWIIFVGYLGIQSESINDGGWIGVIEELIKTGLCIVYFLIGYHTLKIISGSTFKKTWVTAAIIFVFGGFCIYLLGKTGIYFWSDDPKYLRLFMGTDTDPNHAATYLTITFFAMGLFSVVDKGRTNRIIYILTLSISIVGIIFTGSRGGLIGFVTGLMVLLVYFLMRNWKIAISLLCILMIMGLIFIQMDMSIFEGQFTQRSLNKVINFKSGLDERWSLSYTALQMGNDYPITGVGRGNYVLNSKPYFDDNAFIFRNDIPHNTYLGLYAEVGIIGVLLFFMPFSMTLFYFYRSYIGKRLTIYEDTDGLIWLIACICAVALQAFVLNMENRRFLWYISGILVYVFESRKHSFRSFHAKFQKDFKQITFVLVILTCIIYVLVSYNAYVIKQSFIVKDQDLSLFEFDLPIEAIAIDKENNLGLNILLTANQKKTERIEIQIVQIDKSNNVLILFSNKYEGVNGQILLPFIPSEEADKITVKIKSIDSELERFSIKQTCLISENKVYELDKWYFLQPEFITKGLIKNKQISIDKYLPSTDLTDGLGATFSHIFEIVDVKYNYFDKLESENRVMKQTHITVYYKIKELVDEDYTFVLSGYPFDLEYIDDNRISIGYEAYSVMDQPKTSSWKKGNSYAVTFIIPRQEGIFKLMTGIRVNKKENWEHLIVHEGTEMRNTYLNLGWINLE